ncbi:MAG: hypothetical protein KatS3mg098_020 [Candidatus Parcubacteria bacterium]|nr:MAG: hypothetical protein KatS3mg098_020 [Candidatus Parcubacteria bacterium]
MENKVFLDKLLEQKLISPETAQKILQESSFSKKSAEEIIYEKRMVPEEDVLKVKSQILKVPFKQVDPQTISDELIKLIPEETVRNFKIVPLSFEEGLLVAGMVNPDDIKAQEALKFIAKQLRVNLGIYLVSLGLWESILRKYSPYRSEVEAAVKSLLSLGSKKISLPQRIVQIEAGAGAEEAPIIKIVASTLKEAVWQKASDIHIEPQRERLRIRFRIDGELQEVSSMPLELHQPIVSRIKVLANLKIDETRVPQDGRFRTVLLGRDIDFRVATFPTPAGEKIALRVLDPQVGLKGLEELGLLGKNLRILQEGIKKTLRDGFNYWADWFRKNHHLVCFDADFKQRAS